MVRPAKIEDIPRIAEIIVFGKRVAYRPIFKDDQVSFNEIQVIGLANEYIKNSHKLDSMLVYDDGIVKGVVNHIDYGDEIELCDFYVDPFFTGEGFGRELLWACIKRAQAEGKKKVFCWVVKDNISARRFYERNGFKASGQERLIDGTKVWDVHYEKFINHG